MENKHRKVKLQKHEYICAGATNMEYLIYAMEQGNGNILYLILRKETSMQGKCLKTVSAMSERQQVNVNVSPGRCLHQCFIQKMFLFFHNYGCIFPLIFPNSVST